MTVFKIPFIVAGLLMINIPKLSAQQYLQGKIYSLKDSTAVYGASVYYDGTSIGVSSGETGEFRIPLQEGITTPLIISSMGYQSRLIHNYNNYAGKNLIIYLAESNDKLGEVYLETDPWSRKRKLSIFRREFLGPSRAALSCKIENEDAIKLTYIPSKDLLVAVADEPLIITNRHLGYRVTYNLQDFRVEFNTGTSGLKFSHLIYYEGFSFFNELRKKPRKRFIKNRKEAYEGSFLHFLRSLASEKLVENNFRIFKKNFEVPPYEYFDLSGNNRLVKVELQEEKLNILYNNSENSSIETTGTFYIDMLGNHTPPQNVLFSGKMGVDRVANLLPLDYRITP